MHTYVDTIYIRPRPVLLKMWSAVCYGFVIDKKRN